MAYGIIRVRNLHQADLASTQKHNVREFGEHERPANVIAGGYSETVFFQDTENLDQAIKSRLSEAKVKPRSDSVVAIEYVVTLSPEAMNEINGQNYSLNTVLDHLCSFVRDKHGEANLIAISKHYDESNPHAHVIVTPIIEKEVKWKNTNGEGVRKENRLCARDFTGDKDKLRDLQSDYYKYITTDNNNLNLSQRFPKIEFKRGVDARDRRARKEFYNKMTNHITGDALRELRALKQMVMTGNVITEQAMEKINTLETKIKAISGGIEKKMGKDTKVYRKAEKWANTSRDLGL